MKKSLVDIDMNGNEVQNVKLQDLPLDLSGLTAADAGRIYFDPVEKRIKLWDGTGTKPDGSEVEFSVSNNVLNITVH